MRRVRAMRPCDAHPCGTHRIASIESTAGFHHANAEPMSAC
ncbi:hypothetical protein BSLA_01f4858 [Burkholderia stabilis]|nr:hypothetical protein BSLA_01f4858 [Burkholderia stabilis]